MQPADWSQGKILYPNAVLDACYRQCWISQCVSRQADVGSTEMEGATSDALPSYK